MRWIACAAPFLALWLAAAPLPLAAQDRIEMAVARSVLLQLQPRSFAENVEFCGYIGRLADGRIAATPVSRGDRWGCTSTGDESRFVEILASFHTHAGYDTAADSEVPSSGDIEGDMAERVNGYVATPGGRLWYIDFRRAQATQICGLGCMGQDPDFVPRRVGSDCRELYAGADLPARGALSRDGCAFWVGGGLRPAVAVPRASRS